VESDHVYNLTPHRDLVRSLVGVGLFCWFGCHPSRGVAEGCGRLGGGKEEGNSHFANGDSSSVLLIGYLQETTMMQRELDLYGFDVLRAAIEKAHSDMK
jgi:hypothetical protein